MKTLTAWIKRIWKRSGKISSPISKTSIALFYGYENITLKLYLEIANGLDFRKLIISGDASDEDCAKQWDLVIQKNYQMNGGYDYLNYVDLMKGYCRFLSDYNLIKATILKLITLNLEVGIVFMEGNEIFIQDEDLIADLRARGYKIDTINANSYCESLNNAMRRVEHLVTRMKMKANEINALNNERNGGNQEIVTFDSIMAFLYSQFQNVPEDITLSRYNEMIKILKAKHKRQEVNG